MKTIQTYLLEAVGLLLVPICLLGDIYIKHPAFLFVLGLVLHFSVFIYLLLALGVPLMDYPERMKWLKDMSKKMKPWRKVTSYTYWLVSIGYLLYSEHFYLATVTIVLAICGMIFLTILENIKKSL